jgi:hypothetical protein
MLVEQSNVKCVLRASTIFSLKLLIHDFGFAVCGFCTRQNIKILGVSCIQTIIFDLTHSVQTSCSFLSLACSQNLNDFTFSVYMWLILILYVNFIVEQHSVRHK